MPLPLRLSEAGPILDYLRVLFATDRDLCIATATAVQSVLSQTDGRILLDLLEKSVLMTQLPVLADDRALLARNAQAFILSDLRRIASDEIGRLVEQADARSAGRGRRRSVG
jgi:hypothetical protein